MTKELKNQKCQACSGNTPKFDEKQISDNLSKLDNWSVNDEQKMIYKKFNFKTFKQALNFTNKVGEIAESEGHHPDLFFGWGYAKISITTHAIKGLSENDFILAAKIDQIINA